MNTPLKQNNKKKDLAAVAFVSVLGTFIYLNSVSGEFLFDDWDLVKNLTRWKSYLDVWNTSNLRILPNLTFYITYNLFGLKEIYFHITNVFVHILTGIVVYFFLSRLQKLILEKNTNYKDFNLPLIISLIFVTHPIQTSAVSYISQRYSSLMAFFYISSLCLFLSSLNKKINFKLYGLSLLFSVFAFFSKENSYTLPITFLASSLFLSKDKKRVLYSLPYFFIALSIIFFTFNTKIASNHLIPNISNAGPSLNRVTYFITEINVIKTYIRLLLFPVNQIIDYDYPIYTNILNFPTIISLAVIIVICLFAWFNRNKNKLISFGILWFFLTLSIESSFFPLPDVIFEHRLYLPSIGFFIALIYGIFPLLQKYLTKRLISLLFIFLILLLSFLTILRNQVWQSEVALWSDAVAKSPKKARSHYNLGVSYSYIHEEKLAKEEFEKTISINPLYTNAYFNLGNIYEKDKDIDKAVFFYTIGLKLDPKNITIKDQLETLTNSK